MSAFRQSLRSNLSEISRDTCETYITDAKWEEGWKKIATGAFALMSGAGALGVAIGEAGTLYDSP